MELGAVLGGVRLAAAPGGLVRVWRRERPSEDGVCTPARGKPSSCVRAGVV